ncbi:hypothetical protein O3297_09125 [Janthinobacterium sp. SUN128]|uniref:hypothetical protein n=1 Tax=Janthinobacterium sp. SUN128 TaxID=3014790 RepID=UPI0027131D74|nr:hypothetical protein [Janthinobacterium sp. SUN128]MDO8033577.1 hypothetical protein [Janthinobacterium sp. SUN128]
MPDIAQLGLSIDTRQVVEGSKALDSLGEAAVRVEQKTAGATAAVDKLGEASAGAKAKATEGAAAVDALGDAGARVAPKVAGATTSVDSLSAATARVRSTSTEGVSALDNFTNSSAGVWRRGSDAAKSVEVLGDATQRTGQRVAISNGQMDDTAKIMRAQAEQARQAAQATQALGGSTTQLTLGQQQLIERMREQAATIGMSRTQLLAYQAAQMGVTQETQRAIATIKAHEDAIKAAAKAKEDATNASGILAGSLKILAAAYAALKVGEYVKDAVMLAARYETLGVVMTVVGRNAGYTKTQMETATEAIAKQGITMIESRESAIKLVQAHIDLKEATALARIAQNAAVIGHINSSEAFERLVNGIARGNVLILRNIGINVNLQTAYRQMADELGKTTKELSENERVQARLNAVKERGIDIDETYTASMDTAGKQITSMQRYTQDLKTTIGEIGLEVLTVSVMALTKGLKDANGEVSEMSRNNQLHEWGTTLAKVFVMVADNVNNAFSAIKLMGAAGTYASKAAEIHTQYTIDRSNAGFSITGQIDAYKKMQAAMEANAKLLGDSKDQILAGEDKFQKAYVERTAAQLVKRKEEADAKLKVEADYSKAATDILMKSLNQGAAAQEVARKKVVALHYATFTGTPSYRDTEGREPKPKVDQAENTQLADQIKQYEKEAAVAKAHFDELSKLDDMYLKAGELSERQFYENKRSYALATYEAQIDAFDLEIGALKGHYSVTKAEAAKHEKALNEILGKRSAAEKAFFDESFRRDEEERLRKAAVVTASNDAMNKYISSINQEAQKIEDSNHIHEKARSVIEREEVARLDLAIAYQKQFIEGQAAADATAEEIAQAPAILKYLEDQRAARLRLAQGLDQQDQVKLAQAQIETNKKMWESIDSTAQDTFVSIGNSGISAIDRVWGALKNGLFAWLYQVTLKKWIINIGASMTGTSATSMAMAGDLGGLGGAGGIAGSVGATANLLQSAKTAYTIASQGFAGITAGLGTSVVSLGTLFGSTAIEAFGAGLGSTGLVGAADAAGLYAASGGVGSAGAVTAGAYAGAAVTAAAGIAAGVLGGRMISGQYGSNSTVNAGTGIGAVAGAFMGGPIGAAIGGALGGLIGGLGNRVFGMGEKKYGETGITGTLSGTGFSGTEYAKWTQKGGWLRSDKKDTDRKAVDLTTSNAFVETYAAIRNVSATLANTLGIDTSSLATRAQALNINLTGLTTEADRLGAVTKFFEGVGNAIAVELLPNVGQFKQGNEELSTTLQRVAGNFAGVDAALQLIGRTSQDAFGAVGVATIGARENLIKLAGSLDSLTSGTNFFAENFLTEAEQMAPVLSTVADTLGKLGMAGTTTMDDYKKKVLGLNLASAADQELYIKLLALAPAFKAAADYSSQLAAATGNYAAVVKTASEIASERMDLQKQLNELTKSETELLAIQRSSIAAVNRALFDQVQAAKAVVAAKDVLAKAYDREAAAAQTALDKSKSWVATLNGLNASMALGNQSILTPEQKYAEARAQFEKTLAAANAGDTTAQSGLSAAEQAFLTASQVVNASDARYAADYARVVAANNEALKWASAQVDVQQASLDALKAQVSGLITINDSVLTVAQAIANLHAAMGTATGMGVQFDGSHAGGLANVPFDGYAAELHRGEVVVDAQAAAAMRRYFGGAPSQGGGNNDALVAEVKGLREEVKGLRADQAKQTGATIQATVESNDKAAKTVVAGVDKSAKASAWAKQVEYSQ